MAAGFSFGRWPSRAAKARLSRRSRLGTHTRSTRADAPPGQSSPPRPLWLCIADMQSPCRFEGPTRHTQGFKCTPPVTTRQLAMGSASKKRYALEAGFCRDLQQAFCTDVGHHAASPRSRRGSRDQGGPRRPDTIPRHMQDADRVSAPARRSVRNGPWPFVSQRTRVLT
jgi:hypothetical protein